MSALNTSFSNIPVDWSLWQGFVNKYQQNHLRRRLEAIKLLWQGHTRYALCSDFDFKYKVLTSWLQRYTTEDIDQKRLPKGVKKESVSRTYIALYNLISDKKHERQGFLTTEQEQELKKVILDKQPCEVGIDAYIWTASTIALYIEQKYGVIYKSKSIYHILKRLNLSHQRAHDDYSNADPVEQRKFIDDLKKKIESSPPEEKMVCYDEFAAYDKPSCYYGWAEKNTRPLVKSDQKQKRTKLNGLLSIDIKTGDEFLSFSLQAKSEDIAAYFLELAKDTVKQGYTTLSVTFDWAKTHLKKMRGILSNLLKENRLDDKITINFDHTAKYSPKLNLAEYAIHALRQRFWHHLPDKTNWDAIKERIYNYLKENQIFTTQQVQNILNHIYSLVV